MELEINERQKSLYDLLVWAVENNDNYSLTVKEICESLAYDEEVRPWGYHYKDQEGNHSNCPQLYEDIDILNESDYTNKIIVKDNGVIRIGSEEEAVKYHNSIFRKMARLSHKAKIVRDKVGENGQGDLLTMDDQGNLKTKNAFREEANV